MDVTGDLTADIVADQFADGGGEIEIDGVDIFCNESVVQCPVGCLSYFGGFGMEPEVVEQHGCGQDAAERVGDVFPRCLGVRAVDGFEESGALADGGGGEQA